MDTIEFNKLDVYKQIEYINNRLGENLTLREVIERDLNLTRSTIRNRFKKYGYTYNKKENKYTYTGSNITKNNTTYVKNSNNNSIDYNNITKKQAYKEDKKNITENITNSNTAHLKDSDKTSTDYNNITNSNITKDITFTKEEIIALKKLIAKNKKHEKIIDPCFTGDLTVKYIKIYNTVLEDYNKFLKKHKELKHQDVLSLAIKEFLDKYK